MDNQKTLKEKINEVDPEARMEIFKMGGEYMKREIPKHETSSQETRDAINNLENKIVTREVIELMFKEIKELINLKFDNNEKGHKAIEEQTKKTNGRVTSLEKWQVKLIAIGSTLSVLFTTAISIIGIFYK